jgi:hypothetical protein
MSGKSQNLNNEFLIGKKNVNKPKYDRNMLLPEIVARLSEGETLRSICRSAGMPSWQVVYRWIGEDPAVAAQLDAARLIGFEAIAEEALAIADTPEEGEIVEESDEKGRKTTRKDMTDHRKLRVWTRLQLLAKWHPRKYGDKQAVELSGPDGKPLDDGSRVARIEAILLAAQARKEADAAIAQDLADILG